MQAIVCVDQNWGIGKDGKLLFRIKEDMQHFKRLTMGHTVIMGRKTLESLPGKKGLPGRRNLVLTHDLSYTAEDCEVIHTAMQAIFSTGLEDFCIGGESVYRLLLPNCDRVFVTKVLAETDADAHFPNLDATDEWIIESESEIMEADGLRFQYVEYVKDMDFDLIRLDMVDEDAPVTFEDL